MGPSALVVSPPSRHDGVVLDPVLDIFRLRQYFNVAVRARQVEQGVRDDVAFLDLVRRSLVSLPFDRRPGSTPIPSPALHRRPLHALKDQRIAVLATGGSGALASVVGVARALEESGLRPAVLSLCSGSALFGFPLAAGLPAADVAAFSISLRPADYVDIDWRKLALLVPSGARGFAGLLRGERLEQTYHDLLGDMRLGDMPIAAYVPIWNIEENRVAFIGPRTHPDMTVARAVRMSVALPLFFDPVAARRRGAGVTAASSTSSRSTPFWTSRLLATSPSPSTASTRRASWARTPRAGGSGPSRSSTWRPRFAPASRHSWPGRTWLACRPRWRSP